MTRAQTDNMLCRTKVRCPILCAFVNRVIKPILTYLLTWLKLENWNNYWNMTGYKMHVISIGAMIGYWLLTSPCKTIANDDVKSLPMTTPISKQKYKMKTGLLLTFRRYLVYSAL